MKHIGGVYWCVFFVLNLLLTACSESKLYPSPSATASTNLNSPGRCMRVGQTWVSPLDGAALLCVPSGQFIMGAGVDDPLANENEKPQHKVVLNAFWIDRTEITNARFAKCVDAGACHPKVYETTASGFIPYAVHPDYQDYPAFVYRSSDAEEYCRWAGRRLPSEAEWEKAARGTDARHYPWGNMLDCDHANYFGCIDPPSDPMSPRCGYSSTCRTSKVTDYLGGTSPYGILNMAGNVWEWVNDWYRADYYSVSPAVNPHGPQSGDFKTLRGGGAKSLSQQLRTTSRSSGSPQHFFDGQIGFRCAMDAGTR